MAKKGSASDERGAPAAMQLLENSYSADAVADILEVGQSSVFEWREKYRSGNLAALSTKFASGHPTTLSDQQMVQWYSLIVGRDPRQYSFRCGPVDPDAGGRVDSPEVSGAASAILVCRLKLLTGLSYCDVVPNCRFANRRKTRS